MKKTVLKSLVAIIVICAIAVVVFILLPPQAINVPLSGGGYICIKPISLLRSFLGSTSEIIYRANGINGDITIWQDITSRPVFVAPLPYTNSFLCLYNWDGDLRLMRINPNMGFDPASAIENDISTNVVCFSPWDVQDATIHDWCQIESCLTNSFGADRASYVVNQLPLNLFRDRCLSTIIAGVHMRVRLMNEYGASAWPMLNTRRYPIGVTN